MEFDSHIRAIILYVGLIHTWFYLAFKWLSLVDGRISLRISWFSKSDVELWKKKERKYAMFFYLFSSNVQLMLIGSQMRVVRPTKYQPIRLKLYSFSLCFFLFKLKTVEIFCWFSLLPNNYLPLLINIKFVISCKFFHLFTNMHSTSH